jgi:hypothetical protein
MKIDQELRAANFTDSGVTRFLLTEEAYSEELFNRAVALGNADKASDTPLEVTHDHVRKAAQAISVAPKKESAWHVGGQIGEYLCVAAASVGANNLPKSWAIILFGVSLALGITLFVARMTWNRSA